MSNDDDPIVNKKCCTILPVKCKKIWVRYWNITFKEPNLQLKYSKGNKKAIFICNMKKIYKSSLRLHNLSKDIVNIMTNPFLFKWKYLDTCILSSIYTLSTIQYEIGIFLESYNYIFLMWLNIFLSHCNGSLHHSLFPIFRRNCIY